MARADPDVGNFLESLPLFKAIDATELARIAACSRLIDAPRGSVVFEAGDACAGFYAIVYGSVKLALPGHNGAEKVLEVLGRGQSFDEAVMFLERPYRVSAQALEDSKLVFVPREAVFAEIDADPRFARRLLASLSARLHGLISDIEAYSLRSGTERVVQYLLAVMDRSGSAPAARLAIAKHLVASRLNLTQEHFSRILHQLVVDGLIEVHGRDIRLNDLARLSALVPPAPTRVSRAA